MTHGRFYCLQLRTISTSFTNTQQQNANRKVILALFFLHIMNESRYYTVTNKINNKNKYSSPTINNHHGNINKICWPIYKKLADFIVENRTCSMLDDRIGEFYRPTRSTDFLDDRQKIFVGRFYWQTKLANFVDCLSSRLGLCSWRRTAAVYGRTASTYLFSFNPKRLIGVLFHIQVYFTLYFILLHKKPTVITSSKRRMYFLSICFSVYQSSRSWRQFF